MKKYFSILISGIVGLTIGAMLFTKGSVSTDPNAKLVYGDTGLPKNCRAIIYENYQAFQNREYSAEDALESIDRNCGKDGWSW